MNAWIRRLLVPAATSPTDVFTWNERRSKGKQIINGVRIAKGLVSGFVVIMVALIGVGGVSESHPVQGGGPLLASWAALTAAALVMLWTANRWARFVTGFFFGPAVIKMLVVIIVGDDAYYSRRSITRLEVAQWLIYSVAVVAR